MMSSNVVTSMSVLFAINDLDQVGAIIGFVDDGGREPQVPGIIWDKELRFLVAASLVMVLCTLGSMLVEVVMFTISMWVGVPDLFWHSGM